MAQKIDIGYSPLTEKVYLGKKNAKKTEWVGEKEDITNDFVKVALEFIGENTIRTMQSNIGTTNLLINIRNTTQDLEMLIKNLNKRLSEMV